MTPELCLRKTLVAGWGWGLGEHEAGKPPCKSGQTQMLVSAEASEELVEVFVAAFSQYNGRQAVITAGVPPKVTCESLTSRVTVSRMGLWEVTRPSGQMSALMRRDV